MKPATRNDSKRQQQGKADSSEVAKGPVELLVLAAVQGPYGHTAAGLPQTVNVGTANFPEEGG